MECGSGASADAEAQLQHSKLVRARLPSPTMREGNRDLVPPASRLVLALTPSPSPTAWERGVGANGCSP